MMALDGRLFAAAWAEPSPEIGRCLFRAANAGTA